jgi:hypothetical protein
MIVLSEQVFDELIAGTSSIWYTSDELNETLGAPDWFVLFASARDVSGSSPVLKVFVQKSGDNRHWYHDALVPIINGSLSEGTVRTGQASGPSQPFRRLRITLEGGSPKCRLKLHVTGRQA